MKPVLLILIPMDRMPTAGIDARFEVIHAPDASAAAAAIAAHGARVDVVLTNGSTGLSAAAIAAMPRLTLVAALGAGHENVAVAEARARGITVVNGAGSNAACVADHAFALLLAAVRRIVALDGACRAGLWRDQLEVPPNFSGRRLGLLGLGAIGAQIARRAAGFDLQVGYHTRTPRADSGHRHFDSVLALAQWCDDLVVALPGGAATRHLVDAAVLRALGPGGMLVNIARGSIVDTVALDAALAAGELGGAALDVYEGEPTPPAALLRFPNVILTPHVAGTSPQATAASIDLFLENARRHFAGEPVLTPIG